METVKEINSIYNSKVAPFVANNKVWVALFGGAVAAIAIAAIFYPEKSKTWVNKAKDSASDLASKIGESASTYAERIKDTASEYVGKASEYAGNLKSEVSSENVASLAKKAGKKKEEVVGS
jgi:hypothetical protein